MSETMERGEDEARMSRAISLARSVLDKPGTSPIACVIVMNGKIVAEAVNEVGLRHDPTAHGEMVAMRRAASCSVGPILRARRPTPARRPIRAARRL